MNAKPSYFASTIGRKQLVGVTGLGLSLFVFSHVIGNLLILVSPEAYNKYSHALISNPLIYIAEAGLLGIFILHLGLALKLTLESKLARPQKYAVASSTDKKTDFVSKTMAHQGIIILVFVIFHLITFKFGTIYNVTYDGVEMRDLHRLVIEVFQQPGYVVGYIFCLFVLMMHLSHGVSSAFQTIGLNHPSHKTKVEMIGKAFAAFVGVGFIVQPLYVFLLYKG